MEQEYHIEDPIAMRIWDQYFKRVDYVLQSVVPDQQQKIIKELRQQLYAYYIVDEGFSDPERMLNAVDKLGEPESYLKSIIEDIKVREALLRYNPIVILKQLFHAPFSNLRQFLFCCIMGAGYLFLFLLFLLSVLKICIPEIGLYFHDSGGISVGITSDPHAVELLGKWLIPLGVIFSVMMYIALTKILEHISGK